MGNSSSSAPLLGSVPVSDPTPTATAVRRHPDYKEELVRHPAMGVETLYDTFQYGLAKSRDNPCMGYRQPLREGKFGDFQWLTWRECQERIDGVGCGMHHLNMLSEGEGGMRMVGLFSKNRYEWVITEQASNAYGGVVVPLYDTLGEEATLFILKLTGLTTVFAGKAEVEQLFKVKEANKELPLANVVQFEDVDEEQRKKGADQGLTVRSFAELIEIGHANPRGHMPPKPDDCATLCFTSGTTGVPKGAMLSHGNIVADLAGATCSGVALNEGDVHLSYLPLPHMFERLVQAAVWLGGGRIGFYSGQTTMIMEDLKALRPTVFPSVPRLFNRIYDKITAGAEAKGGVKAAMFHKALEGKKYWLARNDLRHRMWDSVVFNPLKARLGFDRVRFMLTGSAPIAAHVMEFLRVAFGPVYEGYGQTESAAAATITNNSDHASLGHVGGPLANNEVKLESVPEMDYLATDTHHGRVVGADGTVEVEGIPCLGRGEVCLRGPNVFMGYYKQPEKTAEAMDADGWLHTGDIAMFTAEGNVKIVDRKKNIFKLSQGEYIAVEKVEGVYTRSSFIAQIFVYGDSFQSCLVAVVVPDADYVKTWGVEHGVDGKDMAAACASPALRDAIMADMKVIAKAGKLRGFEQARAIHLHPEPFSVENDLLTPTFKLKRPQAKKFFAAQIDTMYADPAIGNVGGRTGLKQDAAHAGAGAGAGSGK